jgi:hypothetical protein
VGKVLLSETERLPELAYSHIAGVREAGAAHRGELSPIRGGTGYCLMLETDLTFRHSYATLRQQGPPGTSRRPTYQSPRKEGTDVATVPVCLPARDPGWSETPFPWYCQGCGRWDLCDDTDRCCHCRGGAAALVAPSSEQSEGDRLRAVEPVIVIGHIGGPGCDDPDECMVCAKSRLGEEPWLVLLRREAGHRRRPLQRL